MMYDVLGNIQNSVLSSSQFSDKGTKGCVFSVNVTVQQVLNPQYFISNIIVAT